MRVGWAAGVRVASLTVVICAFLVFLGTAAGESQPSVVVGAQQPGDVLSGMPGLQVVCSGTGKCVVTMSAARSVKATFATATAAHRTGSRLAVLVPKR